MAALDPYTATREECTRHLLGVPFASNTTDDWERQAMYLQDLLRLLAYHPAMIDTGNLAQTYMTPALSKNKIYCKRSIVTISKEDMAYAASVIG